MCGFAGFVQTEASLAPEAMDAAVARMAHRLAHRGPDDFGSWIDAAAGVALGHRRLSIIDLSAEGHQPMVSRSGRYVVAFNGEIYNFAALRAELEPQGAWRGHSDTEVMLAAFDQWGVVAAFRRFNGMFALALWDRDERALYLARDRLGEKPLYYGWMGKTLLFGSELKALRAHPQWRGEVSRDALAAYMRLNVVPWPYSIYQGIAKLPPAHYVKVARAKCGVLPEPQAYWNLGTAARTGLANPLDDEAAAVTALDELLHDAVRIRTVADVPVGVFLSGGIDSSAVAAVMQAQSHRPIRSFSIGFTEEGFNEAVYAKAVARHLGTDHTELYVTPAHGLAVIPQLPEIYDEPFADASQIPTVLVSRLARSGVTVALSGDGGDELFGGYVRYFWGRRIWNRVGRVPYPLRRAAGRALGALPPHTWDRLLRGLSRILVSIGRQEITGDRIHKLADVLGAHSAAELYGGLISHWETPEAVVRNSREPVSALTDPAAWAMLDDFTMAMMYLDAMAYLPDDILTKVDRASMSVGLEARVPMLDHRVVEYAWRMPLQMKIRGNQGKWALRQVLYRYVPQELIDRPKMGFGVPIDAWLRGPLRGWAEELLAERRLREEGFLEPSVVRTKWLEHLGGGRNWQYELWDVLMFQAWLEHERAALPAGGERGSYQSIVDVAAGDNPDRP